MSSKQKILRWLFLFIALGFLLFVVFYWATQSGPRIPACEAMRPYIEYHGTFYFAVSNSNLTSSDLGSTITTIGDGADQAKSCMPPGTSVYSVKGYPSASRLAADFGGLQLFEAVSPTPSPAASTTTSVPTIIVTG